MATESPRQSSHSPRVAIVAVNWNGWRDTLECLESVRCLEYPDYFMVVVDNGSQDDSLARIQEWACGREGYRLVEYPEATARAGGEVGQEQALAETLPANRAVLIASVVNSGPTGGGNLGIEYSLRREQAADCVFLLDNDAQVEKDTLTQLVGFGRKENAGIMGGAIMDMESHRLQYAERTTLLRWFFNPLVKADLPIPGEEIECWSSAGVSGGAMLIRRERGPVDRHFTSQSRGLRLQSGAACISELRPCRRIFRKWCRANRVRFFWPTGAVRPDLALVERFSLLRFLCCEGRIPPHTLSMGPYPRAVFSIAHVVPVRSTGKHSKRLS